MCADALTFEEQQDLAMSSTSTVCKDEKDCQMFCEMTVGKLGPGCCQYSGETCTFYPGGMMQDTNGMTAYASMCKYGMPSMMPTRKPTKMPTKAPTMKPTMKMTMMPTRKPTRMPTMAPTMDHKKDSAGMANKYLNRTHIYIYIA